MTHLDNPHYTDSAHYTCLQNLRETSLDLALIHCGKKHHKVATNHEEDSQSFLVYFVLSGRFLFQSEGKTYSLQTGQCLLLPPQTTYHYQTEAEEHCSLAWIGFKGILAEKILGHAGLSRTNPQGSFPDGTQILSYIDDILQHAQLTLVNDLKRQSILMDFMAYLIESYDQKTAKPTALATDYSQNIYVNHAVEHIRAAYAQNISVQSIANLIGISRTHLNNCFQKELGVTVQKFLMDFRLYQAAFQLTSTTLQIQEIAEQIGYSDPLTFSKSFKKKFKLSPQHYRLEMSKAPQPKSP